MTASEILAAADQDATVADVLEAQIRTAMARLPKAACGTRQARADELAFISDMLERYNVLTLGR